MGINTIFSSGSIRHLLITALINNLLSINIYSTPSDRTRSFTVSRQTLFPWRDHFYYLFAWQIFVYTFINPHRNTSTLDLHSLIMVLSICTVYTPVPLPSDNREILPEVYRQILCNADSLSFINITLILYLPPVVPYQIILSAHETLEPN